MLDEKMKLIEEIMNHILSQAYDPDEFARCVYVKWLDEKPYRHTDNELDRLLEILIGMSAGEEFHYSKEEVLAMLRSYVSKLPQ